MEIDSVVVSWNETSEQYLISVLTRKDGLITKNAGSIHDAVKIIDELEEKYAA